MTNVETYLQKASQALENGAYSAKNRAFIRQLLTYDKKQLRKLTYNQYELLRKLAAEATDKDDEEKKGDSPGHGGAREGAGRHSAEELGIEKRSQVPLSILPSVITAFKKKYGRGWSRRVEDLMLSDVAEN